MATEWRREAQTPPAGPPSQAAFGPAQLAISHFDRHSVLEGLFGRSRADKQSSQIRECPPAGISRFSGCGAWLLLAENFMSDIGPELLGKIIKGGGFHLDSEVLHRCRKCAFLNGVIRVGEPRFQCISAYLAPVESGSSRIRLRKKRAREGVSRAAK